MSRSLGSFDFGVTVVWYQILVGNDKQSTRKENRYVSVDDANLFKRKRECTKQIRKSTHADVRINPSSFITKLTYML
jgi:hypothetical protein